MVCALPNSVGLRLGSPLNIEPALCVNVKQDLQLNFNLLCCPLGGIKIEVGEMQKRHCRHKYSRGRGAPRRPTRNQPLPYQEPFASTVALLRCPDLQAALP